MKNKFMLIGGAILALLLVVVLIVTMIPNAPKNPNNNTSETTTSDISSADVDIEVEDIKDSETDTSGTTETGNFIEPSESVADELLKENEKKPNTSSKNETTTQKTEDKTPTTENNQTQTFEESKKELEKTAKDYLKENNIDPKTAGETGEVCAHCGKKIWNPDKYGLFIPGMPDNYETSGYCLGTCGITFG